MINVKCFGRPIFLVAILFLYAGCNSVPDETWHCYDEQGNPLGGVLIICHYGLPQYEKSAVDYRFSDAHGRVYFTTKREMPRGLRRGYACIYASSIHGGSAGIGERWHAGAPIPDAGAYFDEYKNRIYIKSGDGDPVIWHSALNNLISVYANVKGRRLGMSGAGAMQLEVMLSDFVPKERNRFLRKYAQALVPLHYIKSRRLDNYFPRLSRRNDLNLKFSDVTLELP
jgi:hypothetical protein